MYAINVQESQIFGLSTITVVCTEKKIKNKRNQGPEKL